MTIMTFIDIFLTAGINPRKSWALYKNTKSKIKFRTEAKSLDWVIDTDIHFKNI